MTDVRQHVSVRGSAGSLLTRRFSRHPERYFEIFRVLRKYRLHHVIAELGMSHHHADDDDLDGLVTPDGFGQVQDEHQEEEDDHGTQLASALEELGPCFIKLGQLLSTRPDLLPPDYIQALSRLQDTIQPVPHARIVQIIQAELHCPIDELFQDFDQQPLATASMAQVHRAVLRDGTEVAVKVQRPGVRQRIEIDLEVLREIAQFASRHSALGARYGLVQMVHELETSLHQEMDFRLEAENTRRIGRQIAGFTRLCTPTVFPRYTSARVLTLSFVRGRHLADVSREELEERDPKAIASDLLSAYMKQIAIDGVFHCDPHPGNILLTDDGRLALMDFGMVGRFDAGQKDNMILFLLAFSERLGERVAETYLDMIEPPRDLDQHAFTQDICSLVSRYHDMSGGRLGLGSALLDLTRLAYSNRVPVPSSMTLLGKTMLNLDGAIGVLSPELDPVELIRNYMLDVMMKRVGDQLSPGRVFAWVLDMKHLFENSPRRVDTILGKLSDDRLTVRLDVENLEETTESLNRAATRLALGVLAGSLLIGGGQVLSALIRTGAVGKGRG
ncbi:MAG: AarF/ABC1/UbiB kinase family protein [Chloroflexi bacterium]|nr:AarF/ABC1/UbiB kinase family protein [Chloroflexota bacterium]